MITRHKTIEFWKRQQTLAASVPKLLLSKRSIHFSTGRRERWETFPLVCKQKSSFLYTAISWISRQNRRLQESVQSSPMFNINQNSLIAPFKIFMFINIWKLDRRMLSSSGTANNHHHEQVQFACPSTCKKCKPDFPFSLYAILYLKQGTVSSTCGY